MATARALLNLCVVRIFRRNGNLVIGAWSDLICREIRHMLRAVGLDGLEIVPLDGPDVPVYLKVRRCPEKTKTMSWSAYRRALQEGASTIGSH